MPPFLYFILKLQTRKFRDKQFYTKYSNKLQEGMEMVINSWEMKKILNLGMPLFITACSRSGATAQTQGLCSISYVPTFCQSPEDKAICWDLKSSAAKKMGQASTWTPVTSPGPANRASIIHQRMIKFPANRKPKVKASIFKEITWLFDEAYNSKHCENQWFCGNCVEEQISEKSKSVKCLK